MTIVLITIIILMVVGQAWQWWEFIKLHNTAYKNFALIKEILADLISVDKSLARSIDLLQEDNTKSTKH